MNNLCDNYGLTRVRSYTTRPSRETRVDEQSHIFVTDEEFDKLSDFVAYTTFDRYRYAATAQQVEEADLYIIDPYGVDSLLENYNGDREFVVIRIESSKPDRFIWLKERYGGDAVATELAMKRIKHDELAFHPDTMCRVDYTIQNSMYKKLQDVIDEIYLIMKQECLDEDTD